jgi:hypothetical protein
MFLLMVAFIISTFQVTVEPNVDLPISLSAVHMIMLAAAFFIIVLLDIVLTREIRFYKDCAVKEWYLLGRKRIELKRASMSIFSVSRWRRRTIYPKNGGSLRIFRNLSWEDLLAPESDIRKLNEILASLCNRSIDDFNSDKTLEELVRESE